MSGAIWQRLGLAAAVALLGVFVQAIPAVRTFDVNFGLDGIFRLRGPLPSPDDVVVVSIDAEAADSLGLPLRPDRWPRAMHAELVSRLDAAGASVILFDLIFEAARDAADDDAFAKAVAEAGNVVLLERLSREQATTGMPGNDLYIERRILPIPDLREAATATAPFPLPLEPVKVSQFWAFGPSDGEVATLPAIGLQLHLRDAHDRLETLVQEIRPDLGHTLTLSDTAGSELAPGGSAARLRRAFLSDPGLADALLASLEPATANSTDDPDLLSEQSQLESLIRLYSGADSRFLNLYGPTRSVTTLPFHTILDENWDADTAGLAGKAVFVGFAERNSTEQQDTFPTAFSEGTGTRMSGVEIAATGFANLLSMTTVETLLPAAEQLLIAAWGVILILIVLWLPVRMAILTGAVAAALYVGVALALFSTTHLFIPMTVPILIQVTAAMLVMLAWRYRTARSQRDHVRRTLGLYVPPQVIAELSDSADQVRPKSRLLHGTCLVSDAAQYTSLGERMAPDELHRLLNDYYAVLFSEIERFGGFVADIVGDSMIALWAASEPDPVTRASACRASREILAAVDRFNARLGGCELPTRIGIHSGQVLLANVGAQARFEYRAVGDIVNTATRIQELNKVLQTRELISQDVLTGIDLRSSREIGDFLLPGKTNAVRLHDRIVLANSNSVDDERIAEVFDKALTSFRAHDWQLAIRRFQAVLDAWPQDGPSRFYVSLCQRYLVDDPGPDWDGTVLVNTK